MVVLVEYYNSPSQTVDIPDKEIEKIGWKKYIENNYSNVKDAYCNIIEGLHEDIKETSFSDTIIIVDNIKETRSKAI